MYYGMYNNTIHTYLNIISFDNSITSSIAYHVLSMKLKFMISLEMLTRCQNTIADHKECVSATGRKYISSTNQVSFMCSLYVATLTCRLCVTNLVCEHCMCA